MIKIGKITKQKARKQWRCSKCGKTICVGESYYALRYNYNPVVRRCSVCGFAPWENTSSQYKRHIGRIKEQVNRMEEYDEDFCIELVADLEDMWDELDTNYGNLPDNLQYSNLGLTLEERKDTLEAAIDELNALETNELNQIKIIISRLN